VEIASLRCAIPTGHRHGDDYFSERKETDGNSTGNKHGSPVNDNKRSPIRYF
jgi:hypothetical protein